MGYIVFLAIFSALTFILGFTYISLPNQTKSSFKEWVNQID